MTVADIVQIVAVALASHIMNVKTVEQDIMSQKAMTVNSVVGIAMYHIMIIVEIVEDRIL